MTPGGSLDHRPPAPAASGGGVLVAGAFAILNLSTYALTVLAAHRLGPAEFGQFSSLMGLLLVVNVVSLGLQATAARRVAVAPGSRGTTERAVFRASLRSAAGVSLCCLLAGPLLSGMLRLDSWLSWVALALAAGLLTMFGGQAGVLQGERRWGSLAAIYIGVGIGRLVAGGIALAVAPSTASLMSGVAVGAIVPVLVGILTLRGSPTRDRHTGASSDLAREVFGSTHALLAFFALSNVDALIARAVLDSSHAGLYAAGLVLTKAALFLPQFVIVVVFPAIAKSGGDRRAEVKALLGVATLGAFATAGCAILPRLALALVGGSAYRAVQDRLWLFAAVGGLLAMVQLLVYSALAKAHSRSIYVVWGAFLVLTVAGFRVSNLDALMWLKLATTVGLLALLALLLLRRDDPAPGVGIGVEPTMDALTRDDSSVGGGVPGVADADIDIERDVHRDS